LLIVFSAGASSSPPPLLTERHDFGWLLAHDDGAGRLGSGAQRVVG
jgi:hypothetical protein